MDSAFNATIYGQSWFLDVVAQEWDALIEGDYESVMPLVWNRKWGIKTIYPPLMCQQLGIFSKQQIDSNSFEAYLQAIPSSFWKRRIRLNWANDFEAQDWKRSDWLNTVLDLSSPYDALRAAYSSNCKRNLKKAHNKSQSKELSVGRDWELKESLQLFKAGKGASMETEFFRSISEVLSVAHQAGKAECRTLKNEEGQLLASVLTVESSGRIYDLLQAVSQEGKECRGSFLLIDAIIEERAGEKLLLDFEGSMDEGVRRFYMGFGAQEEKYWEIVQNKWPFR